MNHHQWPDANLTLTETANGILVQQDGRVYRSGKWKLTEQIIEIVDTAIEYGLTAQWQNGHPSDAFFEGGSKFDKGIHHISFAPSHAHKWVFVMGHEGVRKPWNDQFLEKLTFNKKYRNFVAQSDVSWEWEIHRGKNLFVSPDNLGTLLSGLTPEVISAIETSPRSAIPWRREITGIDSEKHLEEVLVEYFGEFHADTTLRMEIRPVYEGRFPDLILYRTNGTRVVLELKLDKPGEAGLQQIREYLDLGSLRNAPGGSLEGALICRDFEPEVIDLAQKEHPSISLYSYKFRDQLELTLVSGKDILGE